MKKTYEKGVLGHGCFMPPILETDIKIDRLLFVWKKKRKAKPQTKKTRRKTTMGKPMQNM